MDKQSLRRNPTAKVAVAPTTEAELLALIDSIINNGRAELTRGDVNEVLKAIVDFIGAGGGTGINELTGDVIAGPGSGSEAATITNNAVTTVKILNSAVTLGKMADIVTARFIARITAGTGVPEVITGTQATTLLDVFTDLLKGLVPASGGGTTTFLRADGTFAAPASGVPTRDALTQGTVTAAVDRSGSSAVTISTPGAGEYTLTVPAGSYMNHARVFGNNTTLNGSNEMLLRIDNSANSYDRTVNVQLYDRNNNALVDQQVTATVHVQTTPGGNITLITIPGLNGFGATGFFVELS